MRIFAYHTFLGADITAKDSGLLYTGYPVAGLNRFPVVTWPAFYPGHASWCHRIAVSWIAGNPPAGYFY